MIVASPFPQIPQIPEQNFHHHCFGRPDQVAWPQDFTLYIDGVTGRRRTFREFRETVYDGATALGSPVSQGSLGLTDRHIVGILSENSTEYVALVHSLLAATVPLALLSSYSTSFELRHAVGLSKATHLFVQPKLLGRALKVATELGVPGNNIYTLGGEVKGRKSFSGLIENVRTSHLTRLPVRPATKDTLAYLVFSSGTSGPPKAVMISHGNLTASLYQALVMGKVVGEAFPVPPPNTPEGIPVALAFLPVHHTYGLHVQCFRVFAQPQTMIILPTWNVDLTLKLITKHRATGLSLIPSVVHQLVNSPLIKKADLSSLTFITSGAAYLPPQLAAKFQRYTPKARFSEGYGQSEGTLSSLAKVPDGLFGIESISGSSGILLPGMEGRVVKDDGSEANANESGELWIRGDTVALGYWQNEKSTKETFLPDGWLRTGDRFRFDKQGLFYFEDRAKDTLKVSGAQVSPVEIEDVLSSHPDKLITDVSVAGVSGGRTSDEKVPRAWIVLSPAGKAHGGANVIKVLDAWSKKNLSKYKWLRGGFEIVDEIPKSPTGKVLRRVLQDRYEEERKKRTKAKL
ncbi:hypothetical protein PLICRDRAFT_174091 [Plicaturopsis crispa FD-325 SS-3]|nr:hypothetical protein PLICRDRAFT_174091 [Plicaturopsis crispa FD-325 SS-3]